MGNQQPSSEQEKAQRLSHKGVECKRLTLEVVSLINENDIVWSLVKIKAVETGHGVAPVN